MKRKTLLSWSSGKDSAWSLYKLQQDPQYDLVGLYSTVSKESGCVGSHGVSVDLLQEQAGSIGLPLDIIEMPYPCSNVEYERILGQFIEKSRKLGVDCLAFGDLFLEDIKEYREKSLESTGMEAIFPIWGTPTDELSREMVSSGLKTVITCVNTKRAPLELIGREFDNTFLDLLPNTVDPCGENGEFHSFVYDGPMFKEPIQIVKGEVVDRDGFLFMDITTKSI